MDEEVFGGWEQRGGTRRMDEAQNWLTYHWGQYFQCCRDTEFEQRVRLAEVTRAERAARTLSHPQYPQ